MQNTWVAIGAFVFLLFLVWKLRPKAGVRLSTADKQTLRKARERARAANTPREKAQALCEASDAAAALYPDLENAKSYLLRAVRVDPTWTEPLQKAKHLLWRRHPASLERLLWRVLARTPWDDAHKPVVRDALTLLASLYLVRLRDRPRARALTRMLEQLGE